MGNEQAEAGGLRLLRFIEMLSGLLANFSARGGPQKNKTNPERHYSETR